MSYVGNQPLSVAFLVDTFNGTGSLTTFTMTVAPANTSSIIVAITGVLQDPSTYSVSGTTLTFSAAPPSGTSNISVRYLGIPASGVTTTAYRTVTEFTATAGQTSFSVASYTVGFIDVYRNGVRLNSADYTATTGTTVVLTSGATSGDTVTTMSFLVSSVLNAIPATAGSISSTYLANSLTLTTPTLTSPVITGSAPQTTVYTSGSGTYTTPTNARYLIVKMVGGGGGGSGGGTASGGTGTTGGTTTFGTSLLTANGGVGGVWANRAGLGGTATNNASGIAVSGGGGNGSGYQSVSNGVFTGGNGGSSAFGGGAYSGIYADAGNAGATNTGGGGSGGGGGNNISAYSGCGGGAGGYVEAIITSPSATYSYAVGAGGTAGTSGTSGYAGGAGGSGVIYVTAYF